MAASSIVSIMLRASELACAAIVAGVNGYLLDNYHNVSAWSLGRFIYVEVVAAFAILFSLIWLIPFAYGFIAWPLDVIISLCWWAAFGLLINFFGSDYCRHVFDWGTVEVRGFSCGRFKTSEAFAIISAILWLTSAFVGAFWVSRHERGEPPADGAQAHSHRWHRRSRV